MNRFKPFSTFICITFLVVLINGCSIKGTVFNHSEFNVGVTRMTLKGQKRFKILQGETIRYIKLKEVEEIQIDPTETRQFERELYYLLTKVTFQSGESVESSTKEKPGLSAPKAFICVNHEVTGRTEDGSFKISMSDVAKIVIE